MSVERIFYCDGPDCERHVRTAAPSSPFLTVTGRGEATLSFCGWDCVLRYAVGKEPEEIIS